MGRFRDRFRRGDKTEPPPESQLPEPEREPAQAGGAEGSPELPPEQRWLVKTDPAAESEQPEAVALVAPVEVAAQAASLEPAPIVPEPKLEVVPALVPASDAPESPPLLAVVPPLAPEPDAVTAPALVAPEPAAEVTAPSVPAPAPPPPIPHHERPLPARYTRPVSLRQVLADQGVYLKAGLTAWRQGIVARRVLKRRIERYIETLSTAELENVSDIGSLPEVQSLTAEALLVMNQGTPVPAGSPAPGPSEAS